jgi:hypothetical protein
LGAAVGISEPSARRNSPRAFGTDTFMNIPGDQQLVEVATAVMRALLDLQCYGSKHTVDYPSGEDLQVLISAGAFSPESAAFLTTHRVRFLGFRWKPIRPDIPVLDVELADRTPPLHVIGFRDGHAQVTEKAAEPTT